MNDNPKHRADDGRPLRDALGAYPTGVAIVTALGENRRPVGMTINSFAPVSLTPPLVSWSIRLDADSYAAFAGARRFTITILGAQQTAIANRFATRGADKFRDIESGGIEPPVIPGGLAWFCCETHCSILLGDHRMLIGRILEFGRETGSPLVFAHGSLQGLPAHDTRVAA